MTVVLRFKVSANLEILANEHRRQFKGAVLDELLYPHQEEEVAQFFVGIEIDE